MKILGSLKDWQTGLPNWLTLARIAIIPILLILYPFNFFTLNVVCALLFGVAAITDFLDGFLARRFGTVSKFGAILDPIADKLLVVTGLILLVDSQAIPSFIAGVLILREVAISGLRLVALEQNISLNVNTFGKIKTACQTISIFCLMITKPIFGLDFHLVGMIILWMAVLFSLYSAYLYIQKFWHEAKLLESAQ